MRDAVLDRSDGRGILASVVASALFGVLFVIPPLLEPLSPDGIFGWRVVLSFPLITVLLLAIRWWPEAIERFLDGVGDARLPGPRGPVQNDDLTSHTRLPTISGT